jgi:hypothetical protein
VLSFEMLAMLTSPLAGNELKDSTDSGAAPTVRGCAVEIAIRAQRQPSPREVAVCAVGEGAKTVKRA